MASAATPCFGTRSLSGPAPSLLTLAPLGIPLVVELAGSDDLDMLAAACRRWHGVPTCLTPRLHLRIQASGEPEDDGAIGITVEDRVMRLRGGGVEGAAD